MGGSGGTAADSLIGGRQAATLLTKATWTAGGLFLTIALVLSVLSSRSAGPDSILRDEFQTAPVTTVKADHHRTMRVRTFRGPRVSPSQPLGISNTA